MAATAKAKTAKSAPPEEPNLGSFVRARKLDGFKRVHNILRPYCERELTRAQGAATAISARRQGDLIAGPHGAVLTNDGRDQNRSAIKRELTEFQNSTFSNPNREAELRLQLQEIDAENEADAKETAEVLEGVPGLQKLIDRCPLFIRDCGETRVAEVAIPKGVGDGRAFDKIKAEQAAVAAQFEKTELAPRALQEMKDRLRDALPEIFKVGYRTINLDKIALPDAGNPRIEFNGKSVRDPISGSLIELPTANEFVAFMFEDKFTQICEKKLEAFAKRQGNGITSEERKTQLRALAEKRFDLHLKLVGEWEACRAKRIPVALPGDLSLFAFCGLKPRRRRDYFAPLERDSARFMRD